MSWKPNELPYMIVKALKPVRTGANASEGAGRLAVNVIVTSVLTEELLSTMVREQNLDAFDPTTRLYLCRDRLDVLARVLRPESTVVIGGRRRWWPTGESRLAKALRSRGRQMAFVSLAGGDYGIADDGDSSRWRRICRACWA